MTPSRTALPLLATGLVAVLAAGCGGGSPRPAAVATTAPPGPTASTAAPSATEVPEDPLSPKPALESPAPLGQPTCRAATLSVLDADSVIDQTTVQEVFLVRTSDRPCQLRGWPAVRLLDAAGHPLAVTVGRGGYGLPRATPAAVTLTTGTTVSFLVATKRSGSCHEAAQLEVTLPGTTAPLRAATGLTVCDGAGTSPVQRLSDTEDDQTTTD